MMNNRRVFLTAAACLCLLATPALAGKPTGGSKRDPILRIWNDHPEVILGVLLNPSEAQLTAAQNATTIDEFKSVAGDNNVLGYDERYDYHAKAGANTVYYVNLNEGELIDTVGYNLRKGETIEVRTTDL